MPTVSFDDVLGLDDEFDPLMADDLEIDQEDMDDDNPLDTVDYPTMRNMPQSMQREAVYTPKRQGGVESAVLELLDHNPGRRPVLLSIMGLCRGGCAASRVASDRSGTCDAAFGGSSRRCEEGGEPCLRKPSTWLRS